jgi:hypothetical protein
MLSSTIVVIALIVVTAALCVVIEMRSRQQSRGTERAEPQENDKVA